MEKETKNRVRRIRVKWTHRSIEKGMFEKNTDGCEVQGRMWLVIPNEDRLLDLFVGLFF